jgi:hypothetical protein
VLAPGTGNVVAHGHEEHYSEPKNGGDDNELRALGAVLCVHEKEHNKRSFKDGDGEGDNDVQAGEILIEIDFGSDNGQKGADHESGENGEIERW